MRAPIWRLAVEAHERFPTGLVLASQPEWVERYFAASRPLDRVREARAVGIRTVAVPDALVADPAIADAAELILPFYRVGEWRMSDIVAALSGRTAT